MLVSVLSLFKLMLSRIFRNSEEAFINDKMNGNAQHVSVSVELSLWFHVAKCNHR